MPFVPARPLPLRPDGRAKYVYVLPAGLLLAVFLTAGGCQPPEEPTSDVTVTWEIAPEPPSTGATTVTVTLTDSTSAPIEDAHVALEGTMTHPGMQPVRAEAEEVAPGRYEAVLTLTMGGDWMLLLDATLPDGRTVQQQKEVPGVRTL